MVLACTFAYIVEEYFYPILGTLSTQTVGNYKFMHGWSGGHVGHRRHRVDGGRNGRVGVVCGSGEVN